MGKSIKTRTRYSICGSDFSAQEPRSTASLANDESMSNAYKEGKDLYAVIGSKSFHVPYEECLEFKSTLVDCEPHGEYIDDIDGRFTFLSTDIIDGVCALTMKVGDTLRTDSGTVIIDKVELDLPYINIFVKK